MGDLKHQIHVLDVLEALWAKYPEMRLGQLIENALPAPDMTFYVSDDKLVSGMEKLMREARPA